VNSVSLIGRLTRDPDLRQTSNGRPVCDLRLAIDGREEPVFIDVTCFDAQATNTARYVTKGRMVGVEGRLVYDEWTTDSGEKRSRHKVIGRVHFLPGGRPDPDPADGQTSAAVAESAA